MRRKLKLTLVVLFAVTLLLAAIRIHDVLSAGNGFVAKNICSGHFVSSMSPQLVMDQALKPVSSAMGKVQYHIDPDQNTVDASFLGLAKRRAVFMDGTGCTLLAADTTRLDRQIKPLRVTPLDKQVAWPHGSASVQASPALADVLAGAFSEPDPENPRNTKAVVVIHKGQLIAEQYAEGIDQSTPLIGWSMTKSVTNLLVGILVNDGALSLDQPAPVPAWQIERNDPRGRITIDQLMRMNSGLEFDESYSLYTDVSRMLSVENSAADFAASKPLVKQPGSHWAYSSGTSNILAGIIRRTIGGSHQDYYEFLQKRLFHPLGILSASMETDNDGTSIGSSYMYASARDWARLGQFCLQNGVWRGERMLPVNWIKYSTTPTTNNPQRNYGAHFWLNERPENPDSQNQWPSLPTDTYSMNGFQGQRVIIVPSSQLVVVRLGFSLGGNRGIEELVASVIKVSGSLSPD